jgi:hypothetical protein
MVPELSLTMELGLEAARRELHQMNRDEAIAMADQFMGRSVMQEVCLRNSLKRVAELEIQLAIMQADPYVNGKTSCPGQERTRRHGIRGMWSTLAHAIGAGGKGAAGEA